MKLRATVVRTTGHTKYGIGRIQEDQVVESVRLPPSAWVEIHEKDGLYYLVSYTATGSYISDTCHLTLDEAKEQAWAEFDIPPASWQAVEVNL
jgi:hypothetical protein